jgi:hypothetical protein
MENEYPFGNYESTPNIKILNLRNEIKTLVRQRAFKIMVTHCFCFALK